MAEPLVIPIAHDFICPWCWVGLFQAKRLKAEFGVSFEWFGHELIPEEMEWPEPKPAMPEPANKPPILSRFEFLKLMDGVEVPKVERPKRMRMYHALEAVEYMKEHSPAEVDAFVEEVYRAYWERGERVGDIDVLVRLAEPFVAAGLALRRHDAEQVPPLQSALEDRRYRDRIVHFDAPSYAVGIFNVPTFTIGGERYAEQPYKVLEAAMGKVLGYRGVGALGPAISEAPDQSALANTEPLADASQYPNTPTPQHPNTPTPQHPNTPTPQHPNTPTPQHPDSLPYEALSFPSPPAGRPYIYINMVATIDGKIISGSRDEPVVDLGSDVDHQAMKRIEAASDAVLLGAQTLRAAKKSWSPRTETRVVVTRSGNLPFDSCFFSGKAIVATSSESRIQVPDEVEVLPFDDLRGLLQTLRTRGFEKLLVLGGSTLNAEFFARELVDEIFITVAPKIKLGQDVPTIADGNALPRQSIQNYSIVEQHRIGDEIFARYRRNP